jgi:hypothetical protein
MVLPVGRDLLLHESRLHVQRDVVSLKPTHLKSRVKLAIRDILCDVLKAQGSVRLIANNHKRVRAN